MKKNMNIFIQCVSICTSIEAIRSELHKNLPVTFAIQNGRDSGSAAAASQSHQNRHPSIHINNTCMDICILTTYIFMHDAYMYFTNIKKTQHWAVMH